MAELSDDTLSDDDPLKRNEELEEGHPFRGLVFHWASDIGGWGNKALGDDDQAWPPDAAQVRPGIRALNRRGPHVSTVVARVDRPRYLPHQPPKEHDR